jgi:ABC-2 type transport system permease protein
MVGKIVGYGALSLLQVTVWVSLGVVVAGRFIDLTQLGLTFTAFLPSLPFFLLGYLLVASLFAAVGAAMKEAEGGSQVYGLVVMIPMLPLFIVPVIMMNPDALWVRVLSHLPPFIPVTMLLRLAATRVAAWEMVTSLAVLACSVALFVHLGARIFKGGMLQYERELSLRDLRLLLAGRRR